MYAVLRLNSFDEREVAGAGNTLGAFNRIHSAQPGYVSSVVVDLGGGHQFALNLRAACRTV